MHLTALLRRNAQAFPATAVDVSLVDAAVAHGVGPLVYRALRGTAAWPEIDGGVRERLTRLAREAALVEDIRAAHLSAVVREFENDNVRPLLFKGASLAATHYAEPWLRTRGDADLLVASEEAARSGSMLERMGFARVPRPSGTLVTQQSRYEGTVQGIPLAYDVHWRVADPHAFANAFPYTELERGAVDDHPSGARRVSDVHALAIACVHRAAHHYDAEHLILLYDIHLLAERFSDVEWESFVEFARARRLRAVCERGLRLAADGLGSRLPIAVQNGLAGGEEEPTALYVRSSLRRIDVLWSDLAALPNWRDRLQLLLEHTFPGRDYLASTPAGQRGAPVLRRLWGGARKWLGPIQK